MDQYHHKVLEAVAFLHKRLKTLPETGLLLGSGLGNAIDGLHIDAAFEYRDIPHFPISTVASHMGRLICGALKNRQIIVMQGRFHLYEGYSALEVAFPIRVMRQLGIREMIITNAAGGIHPGFRQGDIMIITDHINLTGENPLVGPNIDAWGSRFPDMTGAYDGYLGDLARDSALAAGINIQKGVYAGLKGPSLETPAEILFLRTAGADAVGLSIVLEVIAAVHGGIRVLGLSGITNISNPDKPEPVTVETVIEAANKAAPGLNHIIGKVIESIPSTHS